MRERDVQRRVVVWRINRKAERRYSSAGKEI